MEGFAIAVKEGELTLPEFEGGFGGFEEARFVRLGECDAILDDEDGVGGIDGDFGGIYLLDGSGGIYET